MVTEVYVVETYEPYEDPILYGIFTDEEYAKKVVKETDGFVSVVYYEVTLDEHTEDYYTAIKHKEGN